MIVFADTLMYRTMLAVNREKTDSVSVYFLHNDTSGCNKSFFVCDGKILFFFDRCDCRGKTRKTDNRIKHGISAG